MVQETYEHDEVISLSILVANVARIAKGHIADAGRLDGELFVEFAYPDPRTEESAARKLREAGYTVRRVRSMDDPDKPFGIRVRG